MWASSSIELRLEGKRRDYHQDPYDLTLDYFVAPATSDPLLAFFTLVLEAAEHYVARAVNYMDRFYAWGGGQMVSLRAGPDPGVPRVVPVG